MNKLIILAVLIAFVAADCTQYTTNNGCGNGTEKCPHFYRSSGQSCIDCSSNNDPCGNNSGVCSSYKAKNNAYCINCSSYINSMCGGDPSICSGWLPNSSGTMCMNCEVPKVGQFCHPECAGYSYDSDKSMCTYNSSGKFLTFAATLLLLTFIF